MQNSLTHGSLNSDWKPLSGNYLILIKNRIGISCTSIELL